MNTKDIKFTFPDGRECTIAEIQDDVIASHKNGYTHTDLSFTSYLVQGLVDKIVELENKLEKLANPQATPIFSIHEILGKKIAIHCATDEEAKRIGKLIGASNKFIDCALDDYGDELCISIDIDPYRLCYDKFDEYVRLNYEIIPSTQII